MWKHQFARAGTRGLAYATVMPRAQEHMCCRSDTYRLTWMSTRVVLHTGLCQETSYTAVTLNPESSFTRREKNHSLFHWNTLTSPELLIRIWMLSKRNASMIVGISMDQEICLILGHLSLSLSLLEEKPPDGYMWSRGRLTKRQVTSRPDHLWPEPWIKLGRNAKLREKQK